MNFLDVRTVMFNHIITSAVCTAVLIILWFQNRKRFAGTVYWVLDFVFQTAGSILIVLRGSIPDWISMGLSNTFVIAGALFGYIGLLAFVGKRSSQFFNYILLAVFVLIQNYYIFIHPNLEIRTCNISIALLVICSQCAWLLLHRVEPGMRQITKKIGWVFGIFCLVSVVRLVEILIIPTSTNDFFQSGLYDTLLLITYQILLILLTFMLALMVNQRLLEEIKIQENKFSMAFHSSPYAITLTRASDGKILDVNQEFTTITGYPYCDVIGKTTIELKLWVNDADRESVIKQLSLGKLLREKEFQFRKKSGESISGLFSAEIIMINHDPWILSSIIDISERKRTEEALHLSEAKLRALFAGMTDLVIIYDIDGRYIDIAPTNPANFIRPLGDMLGRNLHDIIPKKQADFIIDKVRKTIETGKVISGEYTLLIAGKETWFSFNTSRISDTTAIWVAHDTTLHKRIELVQNAIYRITQTAITSVGVDEIYPLIHSILKELVPADNFFIALYDQFNRSISFPYYIDQYNETPPPMIRDDGLTGFVIRTSKTSLATREVINRLIQKGEVDVVGTVCLDWLGVPLIVEGLTVGVMALQSYTEETHFDQESLKIMELVSTQVAQVIERKRLEEEVRSLTLTDDLTGLYNRRGFKLLAEEELKLAHRKNRKMIVFFADVDELKMINDSCGHALGDQALKEVSDVLKNCFREGDILARFGGDEFVVLAVDASLENAETITNRIQTDLERLTHQSVRSYKLSISVGYTSYDPETPRTVSELISQADDLMYQQKHIEKE